MLDADEVVARCLAARDEHTPPLAIRDVLEELVADPATLAAGLGPVHEGGIQALYRAADLTVLRIAWTPGMTLQPHNHAMFAVVGMYGGQEDNAFFRRAPNGLEAAGGRDLVVGDVHVMGHDAIHAVANTRNEYAVALHVYGGDFFDAERSEWDPLNFEERPRDLANPTRQFAEANAKWSARQP